MCGRFSRDLTWEEIEQLYGLTPRVPPNSYRQSFNVAPSQAAPACVLDRDGERRLAMLRWGLIPAWAKDARIGYKCINARAESVATAPAFRAAFKRRRCLLPADGFYEWLAVAGGKQPYRITLADGRPFSFAGLWESWEKGGEPVESFAILTTGANELLRPIHDRMPVIIDPANHDAWLHAADTAIPQALLAPYPADAMKAFPVDARVNSPKNDDASLVLPMPQADQGDLYDA